MAFNIESSAVISPSPTMGRFSFNLRDLFRRSKKSTRTKAIAVACEPSKGNSLKPSGIDIASLPVAGMQRSNQASYVSAYTGNALPSSSAMQPTSSGSIMSGATAADSRFNSRHGVSECPSILATSILTDYRKAFGKANKQIIRTIVAKSSPKKTRIPGHAWPCERKTHEQGNISYTIEKTRLHVPSHTCSRFSNARDTMNITIMKLIY